MNKHGSISSNTIELNNLNESNSNSNSNTGVINSDRIVIDSNNTLNQYPSFTKFGIQFIRIGNTYCFKFDINQEPKYTIGRNYLRGLIIFAFYTVISIAFVIMLCFTIPWLIFPYLGLVSLTFLAFFQSYLLNPGIILKSIVNTDDNNLIKFCENCQIYVAKESASHHCHECDICIEGYDHHCGVIGKCIGKNNKKWFLLMVGLAGILYFLTILGSVFYFCAVIAKFKMQKL